VAQQRTLGNAKAQKLILSQLCKDEVLKKMMPLLPFRFMLQKRFAFLLSQKLNSLVASF